MRRSRIERLVIELTVPDRPLRRPQSSPLESFDRAVVAGYDAAAATNAKPSGKAYWGRRVVLACAVLAAVCGAARKFAAGPSKLMKTESSELVSDIFLSDCTRDREGSAAVQGRKTVFWHRLHSTYGLGS